MAPQLPRQKLRHKRQAPQSQPHEGHHSQEMAVALFLHCRRSLMETNPKGRGQQIAQLRERYTQQSNGSESGHHQFHGCSNWGLCRHELGSKIASVHGHVLLPWRALKEGCRRSSPTPIVGFSALADYLKQRIKSRRSAWVPNIPFWKIFNKHGSIGNKYWVCRLIPRLLFSQSHISDIPRDICQGQDLFCYGSPPVERRISR